jgi:small subunit ribosomal protein S20
LPHHKSAKKRVITNEKSRLRNRQNRAELRSTVKGFRALAEAGEKDQMAAKLPAMHSLVDVQARKGVIPKRRASRLKSRLAALTSK